MASYRAAEKRTALISDLCNCFAYEGNPMRFVIILPGNRHLVYACRVSWHIKELPLK